MLKPGMANAPYEIELSDARSRRSYGLKVPQGSLQIGTVSQDDTVYVRNVGKRVGDFDEQRSWKAGRGQENLSDNGEAYWDSMNAWTLSPSHVHQGLQWFHARGLRSEDLYMPTRDAGDVEFKALLGAQLYVSNIFTASASYNADKAYLWIRRRGTPGTLTLKLHSDSSGEPGTVLQTVTKTITDITDYISVYQVFDWTGTEALTSGTVYHLSVYGASTDDTDNHWEVGANPLDNSGKISADGSTWAGTTFAMYYRVTDADTARRWFRFTLSDAFYIVDSKDDNTTASVMYINGDRGKATSATSTTLTDSARSWTTDRWVGAWVRITKGTGSGQSRQITANTATQLTVATWTTNPDNTSEFVIYATEWFTQVTFSGGTPTLGTVKSEPAVANNVAYIPQGTAVILHMQWNASTKAHDGYAETAATVQGLADFVIVTNDRADGPVIWRANNNSATGSGGDVTVSRANLLSSGAYIAWNTQLTFNTTAIKTGSSSFKITGLGKKEDLVYVFREDGLGILMSDKFTNVDTGTDKTPSPKNGSASISTGQFVYYSWLHSLIRIYGSTHDDIGDDYRSAGLPDGREGNYADLESYLKLLFCAIDANTGTSSVLVWDGLGWHEMIRGWAGGRIRFCKMQVCPETRNRLWTNIGGDLVYQEMPLNRAAPRLDNGACYQHEAVIESASIDMGAASGLPKFIKDLTVTVANLNANGREVYVDFQVDDNVHTTNWTPAGMLTESPESVLFLGLENVRRFAYRLRICSNENSVYVDVTGAVPNGYARTPFKMVFTMQIDAGGIYSRKGKTATSGELMRWLLDSARQPGRVKMTSVYEMAHGWFVVIHPPRQFPIVPKKGRNPETASMTITLQEV
jgi:hypothetical protein